MVSRTQRVSHLISTNKCFGSRIWYLIINETKPAEFSDPPAFCMFVNNVIQDFLEPERERSQSSGLLPVPPAAHAPPEAQERIIVERPRPIYFLYPPEYPLIPLLVG